MPTLRSLSSRPGALGLALLPLLAACKVERRHETADNPLLAPADSAPAVANRVKLLESFHGPESVRYDPDQDVYFVSNMLGYGSVKDGNGYIVRIAAGDFSRIELFAQGGRNGVTLDAPKGLAIQGDTLWALDIDQVRGFERHSGAPVATIDLRPQHAQLLNDVAVGPDGALYLTDTGIEMSTVGVKYPGGDRIFRIGPGHSVSVVAEGKWLRNPNGITWDRKGNRWIVVSFDPFVSQVYTFRPGDTTRTDLARGIGRFDGVEALDDGRILYTCWNDSSLHVLSAGGKDARIVRNLFQPADIGVDTRRNRVAIPVAARDQVEIYDIPKGDK